MSSPYRRERVEREITREVAEILLYQMKDPRLGFMSVMRTKISKDFKIAHVFVSVMGPKKDKTLTMKGLKHSQGFIQKQLGSRLKMRDIPHVELVLDDSVDKTFEITGLIDKVAAERKAREAVAGQDKGKGEEE